MPRKCATPNCDRHPRTVEFRWCDECTAIVLRTGRPPEIPEKFVPPWLAHLRGRDETGRMVA
jgi:hypothetical protein